MSHHVALGDAGVALEGVLFAAHCQVFSRGGRRIFGHGGNEGVEQQERWSYPVPWRKGAGFKDQKTAVDDHPNVVEHEGVLKYHKWGYIP